MSAFLVIYLVDICIVFHFDACYVHAVFRNSFSQLVGEEFLKYFDFSGYSLDAALRQFVRHLTPTSEPQDRDQLLSHFAQHYYSYNSNMFKSAGNTCVECYFCCLLSHVFSFVRWQTEICKRDWSELHVTALTYICSTCISPFSFIIAPLGKFMLPLIMSVGLMFACKDLSRQCDNLL